MSWINKLQIDVIEEEDGSATIQIDWDENDPDLHYWTNLGAKGQENLVLTAMRSACELGLSDLNRA